MNSLRLGYTETSLLFLYFLKERDGEARAPKDTGLVQWLLSTSGYYDSTITGDYFNFNVGLVLASDTYNAYFTGLLNYIRGEFCGDLVLQPHKHVLVHDYAGFQAHLQTANPRIRLPGVNMQKTDLFGRIAGRRLLIIHNLGALYKQQHDAGVLREIHGDQFPDLASLQWHEPGYTFCNSGPDGNIIESSRRILRELDAAVLPDSYDTVIISAGAYGWLLLSELARRGKTCVTMGGDLPEIFGVITKRGPGMSYHGKRHLFVAVPESMRPPNHDKIEGGCYW
jgi:hypothetical protein